MEKIISYYDYYVYYVYKIKKKINLKLNRVMRKKSSFFGYVEMEIVIDVVNDIIMNKMISIKIVWYVLFFILLLFGWNIV